MISQDDIDALSEGNAAMDAVEERMRIGVTGHRELMPSEVRPFIYASLYWRNVAMKLWDEKFKSGIESMSLGPVPEKYKEK